ncbi:MAG: geranylgeranylglyceryl/heptaprenylglyceryl phosphate synthase [Reichenbachiella sp.]
MILEQLISNKKINRKSLAVLIDPDKVDNVDALIGLVRLCVENYVDYLLVGGSLMANDNFSKVINILKSNCNIPVIIFPGNHIQIDSNADGILLLSLISGRNPEFLIGQHVHAAPILKKSKIEIVSVGYMLVNSGASTSASYMSNTIPIPSDKPTIAACTAMAGEMLGLNSIYLDAGSGANSPVPQKIISRVSRSIDVPLIVGGGLNSTSRINLALEAGADMIVLGNGVEKEESLLVKASERILSANQALNIN